MTTIQATIEALSYASQFQGHTVLIKLGGSLLGDEPLLQSLCQDLKLLKGIGLNIVLVHGGSKAINQALKTQHIASEFVDGLRVTSADAMAVIEQTLCGQVNPLLVRQLNYAGVPAIGLSGADNGMLQCHALSQVHGQVGSIQALNVDYVCSILATGVTPVIAPGLWLKSLPQIFQQYWRRLSLMPASLGLFYQWIRAHQ